MADEQEVDQSSDETVPEEQDVSSSEGEQEKVDDADAGNVESFDGLTLEEINEKTGRSYSSKDEALKSIADTFSHIGKKEDQLAEELRDKNFVSKDEFKKELFYRENPDMKEHSELLEALADKKGVTVEEAAESDDFATLYEQASEAQKEQSKQKVLQSNNRVKGGTTDADKDLEKAKKTGNFGEYLVKHHFSQE